MFWLLVACGPDPEVARLNAEVAELKARIEVLEARPTFPDLDDLLARLNGGMTPPVPSEGTGPVALPLSVLDDPASWTSARALLHRGPDGEYDGYRLSAIRRGSLPDRAGLTNGDIVTAVEGHPLTSIQEGMAAVEAVKAAQPTEVRVELRRRGSPMVLTIPVAPPGTEVPPPTEVDLSASDAERDARREEIRRKLEERRAEREAGTTP